MIETTTIEPTENPNSEGLNNLINAVQEFKDAMQEASDAGLTAHITEANREAIERIKSGIHTPEPEPEDADSITEVENAARALIAGTEGNTPERVTTGCIPVRDPAEAIVKGFASVLSAAECRQAERDNPEPVITEPDPLKARIIGMLTENTGCDILDSGGAYGRKWQSNRHIPVDMWDNAPACSIEVYGESEVIPSYDVYHYLVNFLSITEESDRLNAALQDIVSVSDAGSYIDDMESFLELKGVEIEGYALHNIDNTYNYDNLLSQVLQHAVFEVDGDTYIMLQIHGGCDVRGGYTCPQIFTLDEPDYFIMAAQDINARCDCSDWWSDDAGAHYYKDGTCPSPEPSWIGNQDDNTLTCSECGGLVSFYVTESV